MFASRSEQTDEKIVCRISGVTLHPVRYHHALGPQTTTIPILPASYGGTSSNGIAREAGDITLRYQSYGAHYLKILRPAGQMLITTYLAKTDRQGQIVLPLILDKQAKDPSTKSEALSRCLN